MNTKPKEKYSLLDFNFKKVGTYEVDEIHDVVAKAIEMWEPDDMLMYIIHEDHPELIVAVIVNDGDRIMLEDINDFTNLRYVEKRLKRTLRPEEYEEYVEEKLDELHKLGCYVYESLDFSWDE